MIIGLTGSIATGKSTVATMLKNKGYAIVDADEIARQVVEPGRPVLSEITEVFGQEVLKADGSLDRERLGHRIFTNEEERKKLNAIMHPAVRKEMLRQKDEWLLNGARTVIMDIPLLFESKLQSFVEKVLVVTVSPSIQRARLMERNHLTEEEADARIRSQMPIAEKEELADAVIFNNGMREETEVQLTSILQQWGALA